jgi:hypothetical protein
VLANKLLHRLERKLDEARASPWEHGQPIAIDLDPAPRVSSDAVTVGLVFRVQSSRHEWIEVHREPETEMTREDEVDDMLARGLSVFLMKHPAWPK